MHQIRVVGVEYECVLMCLEDSFWVNFDVVKTTIGICEELFPVVDYSLVTVPTYVGGQFGCLLCSTDPVC